MKVSKWVWLLFLAVSSGTVSAQTSGSNSPYSRYGFGNLSPESQSFNKAMGGVAMGFRDGGILNYQNPASYSAIDSLTMLFDFGASLSTARMTYNGRSVNPQNTMIDYISAGFRLAKNVGLSIGLRPYSVIGYNFTSSTVMDDIDGYGERTQTATYLGEGGLHVVYGGLGWSPFKNFSIGANVGYLWGDYSHSSSVSFSESTIQSMSRSYSATLNTWTLDVGIQKVLKLNRKQSLTLGATLGVGHKLNQNADFINRKTSSSSTIGADTITVSDAFELPWSYAVGVAWDYNKKWKVGFDYSAQLWNKCRFPELTSENGIETYKVGSSSFADAQRFSFGAQYIPNVEGLHYRDHLAYRVGVSYATSYYKIGNEDGPKSYTVNVGIALPIMNQYSNRSSVSITGQYEHVAASKNNLIKENYFRLGLGLTFNARWFNKWKFE